MEAGRALVELERAVGAAPQLPPGPFSFFNGAVYR
jgi:hypothetical protein